MEAGVTSEEGHDPRLRFRVWIGGELADETWIDASNPDAGQITDAVQLRHAALVERADQGGCRWLVEIYDPAKPAGEAYLRFGTDDGGMTDPQPAR